MPKIRAVLENEYELLLNIWESSVRATHTFLTEKDIEDLKPEVSAGLGQMDLLLGAENDKGHLVAFLALIVPTDHASLAKIEMLFVAAASRGQGYGSSFFQWLRSRYQCLELEVNEQNPAAQAFYKALGFKATGRRQHDSAGRPFPLIQMRWES